jgi:hypothetical protein
MTVLRCGQGSCAVGYTLDVGRTVAIALLFCTTLLVMADPLACPDGCSRSRGGNSSQVSLFDVDICTWCLGIGPVAAEFRLAASSVRIVSDTAEMAPPHPLVGSLFRIDHPPRA